MNWHQHDGLAESGLSSAILPLVEQPERICELRQFLSGFTHRCRNSLHGIKMSLYLCRRSIDGPEPETWARLERAYQETERLLDRLQQIYRPMHTTMVRSSLGQLLGERLPVWRTWFAERGLTLVADPPALEGLGDYDPMHLGSGLDAFIAWRLEDGSSCGNARLAWRIHQGCFEVKWNEVDGRSRGAVESSRNLECHRSEAPCSGDPLALPYLARVASAHGGRLIFHQNPPCQLIVLWPQFEAETKKGTTGPSQLGSSYRSNEMSHD
jgi:hypothetical protein